VTGGAGCIGLEVCNQLARRGADVCLFDLPEQIARVRQVIDPSVEIRYGSILDLSSLRDAMQSCNAIVHLAAHLGVRRTELNRLRCLEINIEGTKRLLDCAIQHRTRKIVFASSSEVYGEPTMNPIVETVPTQGKTVYAISKLAGEELCKAYHQRYPELDYTILRYFNTYGPYQTAQFAIPRFVLNVRNDRPPVIYGSGEQKRSYSYVSDVATATIEALMRDRANGEVINVGNGDRPVTLWELARLVIDLADKADRIQPRVERDFNNTDRRSDREIFERHCDSSKARALLDFSPKVSLEQGLEALLASDVVFDRWDSTELPYVDTESV
jgi:UDP-glucose 4-epimerase